ncbi:MAG: rRNA methyltransferase [Ignisphaera sp.]|nr:rRNA methyltransferase [Ignisphaera sp.]MCX8168449.1 rRNA methyltransferase [Ignisphaera sp.]MDW8085111.1 TrmH family RNA methyltransferase [Ignisphaera sp.]
MLKVVVVGIEGEINMGFIVRLCKNFNVDELAIVNPQIDPWSEEVRRFAANGADYLYSGKVRIYESLDDALRGAAISACTSGVVSVEGTDLLRRAIELNDFADTAVRYGSVAVVFGRESVGLTRNEISKCDILVHIASNPEYPILNLSHAVGIVLYVLYKAFKKDSVLDKIDKVDEEQLRILDRYVDELASLISSNELQKRLFITLFRRLNRRTLLSRSEAGLMITFIRRICSKIKKEGA